MAQVNALAPSGITSQLVIEPGHWYWNNRELTADRFLYSFVNRKEPTCFGGSSTRGLMLLEEQLLLLVIFTIHQTK